ncbi:MAG: flagellar hook-associated protein FlgK [Alphaproteobacteria bacterium]
MSLSIAINNALSGLAASQQGLAVISQNVSNANTEGYSKKISNQSTVIVAGVGNGVRIDEVTRLADSFLTHESRTATSANAKAQAIKQIHDLGQNLFGAPGSNLSIADDLSRFYGALEALANNPENAGLRLNVVNEATALAENVRRLANSAQSMRRETDQQIAASVGRANTLLLQIEHYNDQISRALANNLPSADLEDQRDLALRNLASEIDIQTFTRSDGRIAVLTGAGHELIGDAASRINYKPAASVGASTVFGEITIEPIDEHGEVIGTAIEIVSAGTSDQVTSTLTGGRIAGLLEMRDSDLADLAAQAESLATMLRDEVNAVHNQGTAFPPPATLTGTQTVSAADAFAATGTVRIAVTDGAGTVQDVVDIDLTALGAVTVSDVVAAINAGLAGFATASVTADGQLTISADNAGHGIAINDAGTAESNTGRGFSHYFGLNDLFVGSSAEAMAVNPVIKSSPARVATGILSTTAAGETAITIGDNRTAQALAKVGTTSFDFSAVGGLGAQRSTLGDYAATIIALNAARADAASSNAEQRALVLENIQYRLTSQTGVNVDEELANMVLFQNAYVMAARVLKAASEMLDVLTDMVS